MGLSLLERHNLSSGLLRRLYSNLGTIYLYFSIIHLPLAISRPLFYLVHPSKVYILQFVPKNMTFRLTPGLTSIDKASSCLPVVPFMYSPVSLSKYRPLCTGHLLICCKYIMCTLVTGRPHSYPTRIRYLDGYITYSSFHVLWESIISPFHHSSHSLIA